MPVIMAQAAKAYTNHPGEFGKHPCPVTKERGGVSVITAFPLQKPAFFLPFGLHSVRQYSIILYQWDSFYVHEHNVLVLLHGCQLVKIQPVMLHIFFRG